MADEELQRGMIYEPVEPVVGSGIRDWFEARVRNLFRRDLSEEDYAYREGVGLTAYFILIGLGVYEYTQGRQSVPFLGAAAIEGVEGVRNAFLARDAKVRERAERLAKRVDEFGELLKPHMTSDDELIVRQVLETAEAVAGNTGFSFGEILKGWMQRLQGKAEGGE